VANGIDMVNGCGRRGRVGRTVFRRDIYLVLILLERRGKVKRISARLCENFSGREGVGRMLRYASI
jgi:hypothetical protein